MRAPLLGRGGATAATARGRVSNTTRLVVEGSRGDSAALSGVDAESNPCEQAVAQLITEIGELEEGVDAISGSLLRQNAVISICGDLLGVIAVGRDLISEVDEILVEECLADMAGGDLIAEGSVRIDSGVRVDQDVNMGGSARVVAGEGCLELGNTVGIGRLDAAQPGLIDVGLVRRVAVSGGNNTGVNTGGVAVPHLKVDVGHGLASVDIDNLVVQDGVDTLLGLADIATNVLATDIVGTLSNVRGQDAGCIASEEGRCVSVGSVAKVCGVVVGGQDSVEVPLRLQTTLRSSGLSSPLTTGGIPGLDSACLELSRAVAEIAGLGIGHVVTALLQLLGH